MGIKAIPTGDMILNHSAKTYTKQYIDLLKLNTKDANLQGDSKKMTAARVATYVAVWIVTLATLGLTLAATAVVNSAINFSANREFRNSTSALVEQAVLRTKMGDRTANEKALQCDALNASAQRSVNALTAKVKGVSAEDAAKLINDGVAYIREASNGKLCAKEQAQLEAVLRRFVYTTASEQMTGGLVHKDLRTSDIDVVAKALSHLNPAAVATRSDALCALQKAIGPKELADKIAYFTAQNVEVMSADWQNYEIGKAIVAQSKTLKDTKPAKEEQSKKLGEEITALDKQFDEVFGKLVALPNTGVSLPGLNKDQFLANDAALKTSAEAVAKNATSAQENAAKFAELFVQLSKLGVELSAKRSAQKTIDVECYNIWQRVEQDSNLTSMRQDVVSVNNERLAVLQQIQSAVAYVAPIDTSAPARKAAIETAEEMLKALVANSSDASLDALTAQLATSGIASEIHFHVWNNASRPASSNTYGSDNINRTVVASATAAKNLRDALSAYIKLSK